MEFYTIIQDDQGFILAEEGQGEAAELEPGQLGLIVERLGDLYKQQAHLPLGIRAYITAYYSNDTTAYISVKASPSQMVGENRLFCQFGHGVTLDGFATTFLDGEEENRVWIGHDGAVENRGPSASLVKDVLDTLIAALNNGALTKTVVWKKVYQGDFVARIWEIIAYFSDEAHFAGELDLNQSEVLWALAVDREDQAQIIDLRGILTDLPPLKKITFDLLHKLSPYQLQFEVMTQTIALVRLSYPWQDRGDDDWLIGQLTTLCGGES